MKKFNKMYYYTKTGEKKLNCYYINIPKELVEKVGLEEANIQVKVDQNKIVIEKKPVDRLTG